MSVALRAAPAMSEQSRIMSRRGSSRDDDELAVGAVVVMRSDKTEGQTAAAYRSTIGDSGQDEAKLLSTAITPNEQRFIAVLAPSGEAAMASLLSQPPGTFLFVKEEDAAIAVYIKFRQAVRALTLVKGKDTKKNGDAIQLAKLRKKELRSLSMPTPVHKLRLPSEAYFLLEHCWKRFLPQVQAVVFELCCEPHLDEEKKLEDWTPATIPPSAYSVGLMPEACGFYILMAPGTGTEAPSSIILVRQVEFEFTKFAMTISDGTLKPSALLLSTSFSAKRTFEPDFTFGVIRDNFLTPDLVVLKEMSVTLIPSQQLALPNFCVDLSLNEKDFMLLSAADAACGSIMPHEPLSEPFLAVLHEMHVFFVNISTRDGTTLSSKPTPWSAPKMKLVGRILPILVELLIASAAFSDTASSTEQPDAHTVAKRQTLAQFSRAVRFDILFMTARSDDAVHCRLTHQLCQVLGARARIPAELVDLVRDLMALFPVFQRLFLRHQGTGILWRNLHHNDSETDTVSASESRGKANFPSFRSLTSSSIINAFHEGKQRDRKLKLFGLRRKPQTKSRKSLSLGTNSTAMCFLNSKALAFFRLSPVAVQLYLGMNLNEGYFTFPNVWKVDPVLAKNVFCSCNSGKTFRVPVSTRPAIVCARAQLQSSKLIMYELVLQLALRFLYHQRSFVSWDRDVALLLRLDDVHRHLFEEILRIVRRRAELHDSSKTRERDALSCELRVPLATVSTLYRLERKRRREVSTTTGDKKYLTLINLFRTKLRELNARLEVYDPNNGDSDKAEDYFLLNALVQVFQWIPKAFLDEWIVLSLKELLQTLDILSNVVKQPAIPLSPFVRLSYQLFQVCTVMLRRTSDPDLQTILVRVVGLDCPALIALLRFVLSPHSLSLNGGRDAVWIQIHVLNFLSAFVSLDIGLPVQNEWESNNRKPSDDGHMDEDAEVIEQLKGELLIRLLGPRLTINDSEQNEQSLWDFTLELMCPSLGTTPITSFNATSHMIGMAVSFQSVSKPPPLLTGISRGHFQLKESFLLVLQTLYTAQDVSSLIDYERCVASHWRRVEQYSDRIVGNKAQEEPSMVYRMVELNLQCLIVLASRRSHFPAIQDAFTRTRVLSSLFQRLEVQDAPHKAVRSSRSELESCDSIGTDDVATTSPNLPPLKVPRQPSADTSEAPNIQPSLTKLSFAARPLILSGHEAINQEQNFLLLEPGLHALALVLVVTYILIDPNLEIDETLCPRLSVPSQVQDDSTTPNDLLWELQQHVAMVELDSRYLEALMVEMETHQTLVSTARLAAIRSLVRLLCPNRVDWNLYRPQGAREYIAKGAFATVYRQYPALNQPEAVAVKVVEHQRRTGSLCAVSGVFNEVSILSKLRGDLAATQLVDFGNHHADKSFKLVMEYCPCSLTEWRASIERMRVPFRSFMVLILRAFEVACRGLYRIHQAGVCHFDIKSDNILVRSNPLDLSRKLLETEVEHQVNVALDNRFKGWLCFGDFGEAKLADTDRLPMRTFTFSSFSSGTASPVVVPKRAEKFVSLTRTRGTEAIKSPEVLNIKGSEDAAVKVSFASDIWSLGCLLYELMTQELFFQNDDWAGLYAHLIVTQDASVLRLDHKHKIVAALNPTSSEEEAVVMNVSELCSTILTREATRRPKLETIVAQVRKLIDDVHELPVTASDETFLVSLGQLNGDTLTPEIQRPDVSALHPFSTAPSCRKLKEAPGVIVPVRLFWNFFLAAEVTWTQDARVVTSCLGSSSGPASKDSLTMDAFEAKYEAHFVHFCYISWHKPADPSAHGFFEELHEEEHRTCFVLTPRTKPSVDWSLFQQLVQHAALYFPVLQRRLRDEAGNVVFVALGENVGDTKELHGVLTSMLLFFLRCALEMPPFELLSCFARDCAQFFEYPTPEFVQHLMAYSTTQVEDTATSIKVQCRCGATVLSVESAALTEALTARYCTCKGSFDDETVECPCFHPFGGTSTNLDDELFPVDTMFVHDTAEEMLVLPLETRSRRDDEVRWVSLDTVSVERAEGAAFRWSLPARRLSLGSNNSDCIITATGSGSSGERRMSRFDLLKRRASKVAGEGISPRVSAAKEEPEKLLVRGLHHRGKPLSDSSSSDLWEIYECELCRLPVCALNEEKHKIAVPLLHDVTVRLL